MKYNVQKSPNKFAYDGTNLKDFDDILKDTVGTDLGRYQLFVICILCIPTCVLSAFVTFDLVFISYTPNFRCDLSSDIEKDTQKNLHIAHDQCSYRHVTSNVSQSCRRFLYDKSYFDQSIVTEWNLVCGQGLKVKTIIGSTNIAFLVASVLYSYVQDKYGRKTAFLINLTFFLISSAGSLLADNPLVFGVCKFIAAVNFLWRIGFVWAMEFVGPSKRSLVNTILGVAYGASTMLLALIAFETRRWRLFGAWTSLPFAVMFAVSPLLPESPRWLVSQCRLDETASILRRMARWQNRSVDPDGLRYQLQRLKIVLDKSSSTLQRSTGMREFFKSKNLRYKILALTVIVAASNQMYYALVYNAENLHNTNFYTAFLLQAGVEPPATLMNLWLLNRFGRVLPLASTLLLSAACCLSVWPLARLADDGLATVMTSFGRFFVCASVAISEQLASELYPTVGRGVGASVSYVVMSLTNCAVQYLMYSSVVWTFLPVMVMGLSSLAAGLVALMLPETKQRPLPDTVAEAESLGDVGWSTFKRNVTCASDNYANYGRINSFLVHSSSSSKLI